MLLRRICESRVGKPERTPVDPPSETRKAVGRPRSREGTHTRRASRLAKSGRDGDPTLGASAPPSYAAPSLEPIRSYGYSR